MSDLYTLASWMVSVNPWQASGYDYKGVGQESSYLFLGFPEICLVLKAKRQDHLPLLSLKAGIKVMVHSYNNSSGA